MKDDKCHNNERQITSSENIQYLLMRRKPNYDDDPLLSCLESVENVIEPNSDALDKITEEGAKSDNYMEAVNEMKRGLPLSQVFLENKLYYRGGKYGNIKILKTKNGGELIIPSTTFSGYIFPPNETRKGMIKYLQKDGCKADSMVGTLRYHFIWPVMGMEIAKNVSKHRSCETFQPANSPLTSS